MKSKKTIGLLILVIAIWGAIAYQVYQQMVLEDPVVPIPVRKTVSTAEDTSDRYQLSLSYPDPFLKSAASATVNATVVKKEKPRPVTVVPTVPHQIPILAWDKFYYMGSIYNSSRRSYLALVKINGVEYMPRVGEVVDEFRIVDIWRDSVQVEHGTERKYFKKNKDL